MEKTKKSLKEWNATIEGLGHGKQTILIRNYKTSLNKFLLYPSVSYTMKNNYLESFQSRHRKFVRKYSLPEKKGDHVLMKYFVTLEKTIERPVSRIPSRDYYIWTKDHVKSYLSGKTAFIWILRVYALKEPYWAEPTPGAIRFANLEEEVSLEGIQPVLSDSEFVNLIKNL